MKDRAVDFYNQSNARWQALEKAQKRRFLLILSAVILALGLTIYFVARPTWVILYNNLSHAQTFQIQQALDERGIRHRTQQSGQVIEVRQQDATNALIEINANSDAFAGVRPFLLEDALENMGMATSDDTRQELFRRAEEGALRVTLMAIEGIEDADVTLNLADSRSRFLGIEQSTASVVLATSRDFDQGQALQIASTIAGSVEGLTIDGVVISDQFARNIFNGLLAGDDRFANSGTAEDPVIAARANTERAVMNLLSPTFTHVRASAQMEVNLTEQEIRREVFTPSNPDGGSLTDWYEILSESAEGMAPGQAEPGSVTNAWQAPGYFFGATGEFEATREAVQRQLVNNREIIVEVIPAGRVIVEDSNITVMAHNDVMVFQSAFENYGIVPEGVIFEEGMTWDAMVASNQTNQGLIESDIDWTGAISSATGIPVESVQFMAFNEFIFVPTDVTPIPWYTIVLFAILAALLAILVYGLLRRNREEEIIDIEPELSVEDLLVSTRIEEQQLEDLDSLAEIAYSIDSEVKVQIDKFVDEKPEAVAQLLRSWMNEGWE